MAKQKIEDVEGIGTAFGERLRACGIADTDALLAETKTPTQRKLLAERSGLGEKRVLKFANMVDLYRIGGVGAEYAELLEASGVDTVPELARRNPVDLTKRMAEVATAKKLTRRAPTEAEVAKWIEQAKVLPRMLTY
jgi:predicted flap endonuclease-1-like 5' DNA nuclease